MYTYISVCLLPCIILVALLEDVTMGQITLPKTATPPGLPTEATPQRDLGATKGMSPLPTITHPPLHTVEQSRDPELNPVEGDIERRRLLANRRRIERMRAINNLREMDSRQEPKLRELMKELAAKSGREDEIKRYLQLRDRYEPLVRFLSSRRLGSKRGDRFRNWLDQMVSKFGRDWDILGYVDHGVWWEPLASLIFGTETMENRELADGKDWWYPDSQDLVSEEPSDWENGDGRNENGNNGEGQLKREALERVLRDMEAEERLLIA